MARIAGVNIPLNKRAEIGLTYVFGIGRSTANEILKETGVDPNTPIKEKLPLKSGQTGPTSP